ncbi:MAG: T9SS type A sorting domain-containing protein [Ignavibacteria bacterium]|nr:T9SS type A sorting domain-containing protein [Ignavibacteria bacterium]
MKTTDGGNNWSLQNTGLGTQQLFAVHFTDPDNGTAVGGTQNDTATIIRTTNGGTSWIMQNPNTTNLLRGVYFTSTDNGFAVGNNGTILRTTNGGNNWSIHQTGIPGLFLRDIYFVDPVTGFICGSGGKVLKTTNGGNSWDSLPSGTNKDLQAVSFLNQNYGSCVGFDGIIIHTDSGGVITSNNDPDEFQPDQFSLSQNYPNPFNPVTVIRYSLSENRFITLKVFDIQGKELETLVSEKQHAGNYEVPFDASKLSSGIYIYSIEAGNFEQTKRMLLLK